jgi:hypothetical protein
MKTAVSFSKEMMPLQQKHTLASEKNMYAVEFEAGIPHPCA